MNYVLLPILSATVLASLPSFKYVPSQWPTILPQTDGYGYYVPPTIDTNLSSLFPFPDDSALNISVINATWTLGCPKGVDLKPYNYTGSCWWTCGADINWDPCTRSNDVTNCQDAKTLGLTYDDGPLGNWTLDLISYLQKNNLRATFFLVGANLVRNPSIAQALFNAGMELGVHTWSHHPLTTQTNEEIRAELGWSILAFQQVLGITPTLFRPPSGDIDDRVRAIARSMGLTPVLWNLDTRDWSMATNPSLLSTVLANYKSLIVNGSYPKGAITLEHDSFAGGVNFSINSVIPIAKANGYTLKTVSQCMNLDDNGWYTDTTFGYPPPIPSPTVATTSGTTTAATASPSSSTRTSTSILPGILSNLQPFNFIPSNWPSVAQTSDGYGYCVAPSPNANILSMFPIPISSTMNIQTNPPIWTQGCPQNVDFTHYGSNGTCWWTCGNYGSGKCVRPTDVYNCQTSNSIGLVFDDGPLGNWTLDLITYLSFNDLKATFFLMGAHVVQHPYIVQEMLKAGMELGIQGWSHHPMTAQATPVVVAELGWTIIAFQQVLGIRPKFFRPPYGDIDDRVRTIAASMGLTCVLWNYDVQDYKLDGTVTAAKSLFTNYKNNLLTMKFPNGILAVESSYNQQAAQFAYEQIIPFNIANGFDVKSLAQCLNLPVDGWFTKATIDPTLNSMPTTTTSSVISSTSSTNPQFDFATNSGNSLTKSWISIVVPAVVAAFFFLEL